MISELFWPFSLLWAALGAVLAASLAHRGGDTTPEFMEHDLPPAKVLALRAAIGGFIVCLIAVRATLYYSLPVFQGSWAGYFTIMTATFVPAVAIGLFANSLRSRTAYVSGIGFLVILFGVAIVNYGWNAWGPGNAIRHAELPNIRVAAPDETIPPTDPDHMVRVPRAIAEFKGQSALSTEPGVASRYTINGDTYVLQSVNKHRYWIAPLTPVNSGDTFWGPLMGGRATSPGYVVVDAEDESKQAWLKTGFRISLFEDQIWGMNLSRFVYLSGWTNGELDEPLFEVDDNWVPHYTVSYVRKAFGGVTGNIVEKVITVRVDQEEPVIESFDNKARPKWIDRVVSERIIREYATDWGWFNGEFARKNTWSVILGFNKTGTQVPAEFELNYTKEDHNVWVIPMTSTNSRDTSVTGVLVFETAENKGVYYPGLRGFNFGTTVATTMEQARDNIKHNPVLKVQLYNIYGEWTWVAIYSTPQSIGKSFGGVGILHAKSQNAADVIYGQNLQTALRLYSTQLARRHDGGSVSQFAAHSKQISARILRIAPLPSSTVGGTPTYMFVIDGDSHIFLVTRESYSRIPLVKDGDEVLFTYLDTNSNEVAVDSFISKNLEVKSDSEKPAEQK